MTSLRLDVRLPVGLMFSIFGALLSLWGLASGGGSAREGSLGVDIDRDWGLVLLAFGATMLALALRARRRASRAEHPGKAAGPATGEHPR